MDLRRFRPSPLVVDSIMAVLALGLALTSRVEIADSDLGDVFIREPDAWNTVIILLQTLPLALRRRYPRAVLAIVMGAFVVDRALDYPSTLASLALVLAIHAIGSELPPRESFRLGVPLVLGVATFTALGAVMLESVGWEDVLFTFVTTSVPLALGREVYQRRMRIQQLEERAERAEREREERARQAVEDERARIARELHDVVAHQMAVMTIQAEGARRLAGYADPRIGDALDVIRSAGHEALAEMRRMVGLLRSPSETPSDDLAPQPGLGRLEELAEQMREAGLPVELTVVGSPCDLSPGIDVNAYRIVQESLTNALKHGGPGTSAEVRMAYGPEFVTIEVSDDGRGSAATLEGDDGGHGLVGMRERVAVVNGTLEAGPRSGGGYRVRAEIPVRA